MKIQNTPDETHPQYDAMKSTWAMCRDCVVGQRAIHGKGETYLPKLHGQSDDEYRAYKKRALFFGATGRTVEGMRGLIFRKYPSIKLPTSLEQYEEDISMEGISLVGVAQSIISDVLSVGRAGIMVDFPARPDEPITLEQAEKLGLRPYITAYKAESIINWVFGQINNRTMLVNVFLQEEDTKAEKGVQIRELHLDGGVYGQRIWRQTGSSWEVSEEITVKKNGAPINRIPFWFCQPEEGRGDIQESPIESLCYVNLAHYCNSADLENGVHISGLPTAWVNGVTDPKQCEELHLGSNAFLPLPPNSTAGFLQVGVEGFASLEKAMDRKEQQMAQLGARMLSQEKRATETAEALEIKRGGENSVLATLAAAVEMSITQALRFMAEWVGANPDDASIEFNKDFIPTPMSAQDLTAWLSAWQSGAISYNTFFVGLQRGELVAENTTVEEEMANIEEQPPVLPTTSETITIDEDGQ